MDALNELVLGCLLYDFKVGLSATASSRRISQAFGDSAVNERTARHWFEIFRSGDLSLCDKARTGRHKPWMTKPCLRPLRRTVVKRVVNLPENSTLPVKCASISNRVATSDENWVLYDTPKCSKQLLSPPGYCPAQSKTTYAPTQDYALILVDLSSSGSLRVAINGPNGHYGPVFTAIGTCTTDTGSERASTG
ncbi:histone-lysine N-methyltransferase SETMAR [Trichonephila clavipes]|nr:histone-lysine N-methyltransferase SETMAR [Trichonephila clavipes]